MTTITEIATTQVYQVFIKATPEAIWDAITKPEFTERYFHGARISITPEHYDSRGPDGAVWGDAGVFEFDPPRKHRSVNSGFVIASQIASGVALMNTW